MWPLWGLDLNRVRCDLLFTEAINQRMQVPNRLKVAESCSPGDRKARTEDVPPSFRMHIPERISLAGKALGCLLGWLKVGGPCITPQSFALLRERMGADNVGSFLQECRIGWWVAWEEVGKGHQQKSGGALVPTSEEQNVEASLSVSLCPLGLC